jgi:hypothetical protein
VTLGQMESIMQQQMLKKNDNGESKTRENDRLDFW